MVTANLFGELVILVSDLRRNTNRYQNKVDISNAAMQNLKLPISLQNSVLSFIFSTKTAEENQNEFTDFAHLISPSLKAQIMRSLFTLVCKCSPVISPSIHSKQLLTELGFIGAMLQPVELCPEEAVIKQGEDS